MFIRKYKKFIVSIHSIFILAIVFRVYWLVMGLGSSHFSFLDELRGYAFAKELLYYSAARVGAGYLPGPWQNLLYFGLEETLGIIGIYAFSALLGCLHVYALYVFIRLCYPEEKRYALIGAFITAIFPWPLQFSATAWNPYPAALLSTLSFIVLMKLLGNPSSRYAFWLPLIFAVMAFFHLMAFFSLLGFLAVLLVYRKKIRMHWGYASAGIVLGMLLYIPFFYFEILNDFYVLKKFFGDTGGFLSFAPEQLKFLYIPFVVSSQEVSRLIGYNWETYSLFLDRFYGSFVLALPLLGISFMLSIYSYFIFFKKVFTKKNSWERIFFIYMGIALISFLLTGRNFEIRYLNIYWPIIFLALSLGVFQFFEKLLKRKYYRLSYALLFLYIFNGVYLSFVLPIYFRNPSYISTESEAKRLPKHEDRRIEEFKEVGHTRLVGSLYSFSLLEQLLLEMIADASAKDSGKSIEQNTYAAVKFPGVLNLDDQRSKRSLFSFFLGSDGFRSLRANMLDEHVPIPIFLDKRFLDSRFHLFKERQTASCIESFLLLESRFKPVSKPLEADWIFSFVHKNNFAEFSKDFHGEARLFHNNSYIVLRSRNQKNMAWFQALLQSDAEKSRKKNYCSFINF